MVIESIESTFLEYHREKGFTTLITLHSSLMILRYYLQTQPLHRLSQCLLAKHSSPTLHSYKSVFA